MAQNEIIGIIKHKVGDRISKVMYNGTSVNRTSKVTTGKVVFVHPYGRFYTVEFDFYGVKIRESYTVRSDVNPCRLY